jgi:transposase
LPTPSAGETVKRRVVERILRDHRIRRVNADAVLGVLRQPVIATAPGTVEASTRHIASLLPRLRLVHEQRRACGKEMDEMLDRMSGEVARRPERPEEDRPSDVAIAKSVPGIGRMVAATLFSEASALLRMRHHAGLRALSGLAPVTRQSGGRRSVGMRYACNARLREACYHWARTSTQFDVGSKAYYAELRGRGHSHGRALRSVADRLLRILIAMLRDGTLFNASLATERHVPIPA